MPLLSTWGFLGCLSVTPVPNDCAFLQRCSAYASLPVPGPVFIGLPPFQTPYKPLFSHGMHWCGSDMPGRFLYNKNYFIFIYRVLCNK